MKRYHVWSLDVWGHGSDECCDSYDCPCMVDGEDGERVHDPDEAGCECDGDFTVNDRCHVGIVDVPDDATDEQILDALAVEYLTEEGRKVAEIDNGADFGDSVYIQRSDNGRPLLQLEAFDAEEQASVKYDAAENEDES